jgi:hypothetical protein
MDTPGFQRDRSARLSHDREGESPKKGQIQPFRWAFHARMDTCAAFVSVV